ncbi:MAG: hypothetical protein ABR554_10235 [Pyrinomonadaceae bacterium]
MSDDLHAATDDVQPIEHEARREARASPRRRGLRFDSRLLEPHGTERLPVEMSGLSGFAEVAGPLLVRRFALRVDLISGLLLLAVRLRFGAVDAERVRSVGVPVEQADDGARAVGGANLEALVPAQTNLDRLDVCAAVFDLDDGLLGVVAAPCVERAAEALEVELAAVLLADEVDVRARGRGRARRLWRSGARGRRRGGGGRATEDGALRRA